jgi:zinc transport system ATP-binding protein
MKTIIAAQNITYSYNKKSDVLEDVSFMVAQNDFIGLIGPNGGGKSTLLKIILGLIKSDQGNMKVFGQAPSKARDRIGYVPQYSRIDLDYPITVKEVVRSGLLGRKRIGSRFSAEESRKVQDILDGMKLSDLRDRSIGDLSGGQRQRVLLARALVREPELLLLDEPTNNVDQESGNDLYELLAVLNRKMTIIIVSHDFSTVSKYVNKIFCLNKKIICNDADKITGECSADDFKHIHHGKDCIIH